MNFIHNQIHVYINNINCAIKSFNIWTRNNKFWNIFFLDTNSCFTIFQLYCISFGRTDKGRVYDTNLLNYYCEKYCLCFYQMNLTELAINE